MWLKGSLLIIFALFIDILQAGVSLSIAGVLLGVNVVPLLGQVASVVGAPFGLTLGIAINGSISLTAGVGHFFATYMTLMERNHRFKTRVQAIIIRRIGIAFFGEIIPGINNLPMWTIATILTIRAVVKEQRKAAAQAAQAPAPARPAVQPIAAKVGAAMTSIAILLSAGAPLAHAQGVAPEPVRYLVSPEAPGPGEQVTIVAEGIGSFLGDAEIRWSVNGAAAKAGAGERSFTFTLGALGSRTTVRADIQSPTQGSFTKTFVFAPSVVAMLWEADTTVPPLYRGKPLYSAGSPLRVLALPTVYSGATRIAPSALSYQWSRNGEPDPQASGLGRSSYAFAGDQLQAGEEIVVDVYAGSTKVARGETVIPATEPQVLLYQYDALRGVLYDEALPAGISLVAREATFKAEPYYFSSESEKAGSLVYAWQLNGEEITGPDAPRGILTLRQTGAGAGQATLAASLQNYDSANFVQSAEAFLQIIFGEAPSSALGDLFGL